MAKRWTYDVTIHSSAELLATVTEEIAWEPTDESKERVLVCSEEGQCFFKNGLKSNAAPFLQLLNSRGAEGWELTQHSYQAGYVYLVWKKEDEYSE